MKRIIYFLLFFISISASAQQMPDIGTTKIRIAEKEQIVVAEINQVADAPVAKPNLYYYWYYTNGIHSTQGGFSGKLLDGQFNAYYLNKSLKEQGSFKKGLKNGTWKSWNEDGTLKLTSNWKNGVQITTPPVPFWKKLPFIRKKKKTTAIDSVKKTTKS